MGYGNFGGTGSVSWKVNDGDSGRPEKEGKDLRRVRNSGGEFTVVVNGVVVARVPIDDNNANQIRVIWPPDTFASAP